MIDASVGRATSSPSLPATVTKRRCPFTTPSNCRWLPFHRLRRNPWPSRIRTTSRTFILADPGAVHPLAQPALRAFGLWTHAPARASAPGGRPPVPLVTTYTFQSARHRLANVREQHTTLPVVYVVTQLSPSIDRCRNLQYTSPSAVRDVGSSHLSPTRSSYRSRFASTTNCRPKSCFRTVRAAPAARRASRLSGGTCTTYG